MKLCIIAPIACVAIGIAVPCGAQTGPATASIRSLSQAEKRAVVEKAGELLIANYVFPDLAAEAKAKLDTVLAAGAYESITSPDAFAQKLTSDLQSVTHDKHVKVLPPSSAAPPASVAANPASASQRVYAGFARIDRLKGNIGYLKLQNFPDPAGPFSQTAIQAFAELGGTDALIIDMRDNGGGSRDGVAYLCSFFFNPNKPVHIDSDVSRKSGTAEFDTHDFYTRPVPVSYLDKPVYLLTGKRTSSSGEEFVYDLQAQKRARSIGEVTSGGANGAAGYPLPYGFLIGIAVERVVNPITKTNWEGVGVAPDIAVDERTAFQTAMREIAGGNSAKYAALKAGIESQSTEEDFVEASLLKFRNEPQSGGADAVRSLFSGIASGKPDYTKMSDELAQIIKSDFDFFHTDMNRLGEAKSVKFTGVDSFGLDDYEVATATFTERFAIFLNPDGKIVTARFYPPRPVVSKP